MRSRRRRHRIRRLHRVALPSAGLLVLAPAAWAAPWTDPASATGTVLTAVTPVAPTVVCPGALGIGSITFAWPAVPNATGYTVAYGLGGGQSTTVTSPSITLSGLVSGGRLSVRTNYGPWRSASSSPARTYSVLLAAVSTCS